MARKLNRSQKNSIRNFVAMALLTVIGLFFTFCSIPVPFSSTGEIFNGFAGSVSVGMDLSGGVSAVYDCALPEGSEKSLDSAIRSTVNRVSDLLNREYSEAVVTSLGSSQILVEVSGAEDNDSVFSNIGQGKTLYLTYEEHGKVYVDGSKDIKNMKALFQSYWGVLIEFTEEGQAHFAELTRLAGESSDQKIHFYLGDVEGEELTYMQCTSEINEASTFIGNSDWSEDNAITYIYQIVGGTFESTLTLKEITTVSATLGDNTLTLVMIALAVALLLVMILMWVRYGALGLLADFAMLIYTVLFVFLMQAVTLIQLTMSGIGAILLSYLFLIDGMIITFEKIRNEYRLGKKIPLSVKNGINGSFWTIFDTSIAGLLLSVVLCIAGTPKVLSFGLILVVGITLSFFVNQVLLRGFAKWYVALNGTKPKSLHFPKQVKHEKATDEIVVEYEGGDVNEK